jgi:hypothetical protein
MDAIAMLKADHQRVRDLFAQYEATEHTATKRTLAEPVFVELETHVQLEENVFYPAVNEETEEGPALVKESLEEHETGEKSHPGTARHEKDRWTILLETDRHPRIESHAVSLPARHPPLHP